MQASPLINFNSFSFFNPDGGVLVRDLSATIYKNKINIIMGSNGVGKSTLLKIISRNYINYSGEMNFLDVDTISSLNQNYPDKFHINLRLLDVIKPERINKHELYEFLIRYPILSLQNLNIGWNEASGGEKQKALILKIYFNPASLMMVDEPFNHLDENTQNILSQMFVDAVSEHKKTFLIVTHQVPKNLRQSKHVHTINLDDYRS